MGIVYGLLSMLGWGTSDFFGAKASRKVGYFMTLFWMQLLSLLIALIYFIFKFSSFNFREIHTFLPVLSAIGFFQMIGFLAFYSGLQKGQVSLVSPVGSSWGLVTAILSVVFLKEVLSLLQIAAIFLISIGIFLVSANIQKLLSTRDSKFSEGSIEGIIAMLCWGVSLFLIIAPSKILGWFLPIFIARIFAVLFLLMLLVTGKRSVNLRFNSSLFLLFLGISSLDMLGYFAYSFGVTGEKASIVAPVAASFPLVTIILARIFFKEKPSFNQNLGIISMISGIILLSLR